MHREQIRPDRDRRDRREILHRVELGRGQRDRIDHVRRRRADGKRVAVARLRLHVLCADHAAAAGAVLDQHLLAPEIGQLLRHGPREDVARAAGRIGGDDAHRPARIVLRDKHRGKEQRRKRQKRRQSLGANSANNFS